MEYPQKSNFPKSVVSKKSNIILYYVSKYSCTLRKEVLIPLHSQRFTWTNLALHTNDKKIPIDMASSSGDLNLDPNITAGAANKYDK
jgi:K+-transporting ATPase c subunit